jgi:hypothetical protein
MDQSFLVSNLKEILVILPKLDIDITANQPKLSVVTHSIAQNKKWEIEVFGTLTDNTSE